jgi:hypothetical protein
MAASEITTLPFHPQSQIEVVKTSDLAQLPFLQAARVWRESRKPYLGERTYLGYHTRSKPSGSFSARCRFLRSMPTGFALSKNSVCYERAPIPRPQ